MWSNVIFFQYINGNIYDVLIITQKEAKCSTDKCVSQGLHYVIL